MPVAPAHSPHRRVRWRAPADAKRRPGVLAATRNELVRGLEQRHGGLWHRVNRVVIVAGYPLDRALHRVRALRADGAESLLALAVALLYLADVRTGFVGKPREGGGPWHRYTLMDLAQLAFGAQGDAELRRARRALDMMVSLGWAHPTRQAREYREETRTFVSFPGIRRLNLDRLCAMTGTTWLLKRDRMHADARKGSNVTELHGRRPATGAQADQQQAARAQAARHRAGQSGAGWHPGQAPPPGGPSGPLALGDILTILDGDPG